jgi:DNA-binding NarL/FixJ family response regulator
LSKSIIIADSSELVIRGLKSILKQSDYLDIQAVLTVEDLKSSLKDNLTSLLIVDYTTKAFPLDDIVDIKYQNPSLKIVAITHYINAHTVVQAVRAGIESHIKKECSANEIVDSVKATFKGENFFCSDIVEQMRIENVDVHKVDFGSLNPGSRNLSERENQIIQFIAEGYTNSQIAAVLYISNHTVNTHRKNIMRKLGVNNTVGIVMYAVKTELVKPNQFSFKSKN